MANTLPEDRFAPSSSAAWAVRHVDAHGRSDLHSATEGPETAAWVWISIVHGVRELSQGCIAVYVLEADVTLNARRLRLLPCESEGADRMREMRHEHAVAVCNM